MTITRQATYTCAQCGKQFKEWIYRKPKFCSRKCASASFIIDKPKVPCPVCNKLFVPRQNESYTQTWCSKKCAGLSRVGFLTLTCKHCKQPFTLTGQAVIDVRKRGRKFCSQECHYAHHVGKNHPLWNGGRECYRGPNWSEQREKALVRDNHKCNRCGSESDLHVHHISPFKIFNGDWKTANRLSNLITLCRSCHMSVEPRRT